MVETVSDDRTERTSEDNERQSANSSRGTHLFAWSMTEVFLNQVNVESNRMNEPFSQYPPLCLAYAPLSLWRRANARNVSFFTLYGG